MVEIKRADKDHVHAIAKLCIDGYWNTFGGTHSKDYIKRIINEFYNIDRLRTEVDENSEAWGGYFIAVEDGRIKGASAGGMIDSNAGEVFFLYVDSNERHSGMASKLLEAVTKQQVDMGADEQWISIHAENENGIGFYESKGFEFKHEGPGSGIYQDGNYLSLRYSRKI